MLRKIYNFIDDHLRGNEVFQLITFLVFVVLGFILFFTFVVDSTPAKLSDYEPLIKQNTIVQENFDTVYTYDNYEISPSENNIKVTFSNDQCKLSCTYDKNFNFIEYKEIDLAESKLGAIFVSFLAGLLLGGLGLYIFAMFLPFLLYHLLIFLEWLCLLLVGRR